MHRVELIDEPIPEKTGSRPKIVSTPTWILTTFDYGIQTQTVRVQRCEVRRLRPEERVNSPGAQVPLEITRTVYTM